MQVIELEDRVIYRPAKGKKVKFAKGDSKLFVEIVLAKNDEREVVEVKG